MFLVSLPLLTKSAYQKKKKIPGWCCGSKPLRIEKHLYPLQHQRDAATAKTQSQRFSGERKTYTCRKGQGEN